MLTHSILRDCHHSKNWYLRASATPSECLLYFDISRQDNLIYTEFAWNLQAANVASLWATTRDEAGIVVHGNLAICCKFRVDFWVLIDLMVILTW